MPSRASGFHQQLTKALLYFSGYANIGGKTALAMGRVKHSLL